MDRTDDSMIDAGQTRIEETLADLLSSACAMAAMQRKMARSEAGPREDHGAI